jgi:hypothetical protein
VAWHATPIRLTLKQRTILDQIKNARTSKRGHAERALILLMSDQGHSILRISRELSVCREKVAQWRNRWLGSELALIKAEHDDISDADYSKRIVAILNDAPRSGCPGKFSQEQIREIIAIAKEIPKIDGIPTRQWSLSSLTKEIIARGIVKSISVSQVQVYLKQERVQLPLHKESAHTTEMETI